MTGANKIRVLGFVLLVLWVPPVSAGDTIKIGVMDQLKVMERTKAGKLALEDVKGYSVTRQKIIDADEQEMKELEKSLEDSSGKLSEAAKWDKQEQFRTKLEAYQRRVQDFDREIQQKQQEMVAEYSKKIADAAKIVAQREGFLAIIDKGNEALLRIVIYHQPALDVTDLVVKEFDRQNQ